MSDIFAANDQMLEMFVFEMSDLLEQLDAILLASEKKQVLIPEDVNEIFRIMHTIKGSSAMMEFDTISTLTHKLEDVFFLIREQGLGEAHFSAVLDLMLEATDFLKGELAAIQGGAPLGADSGLIDRAVRLYSALSGQEEIPGDALSPEKLPDLPSNPKPEKVASGKTYQIDVLFEEDCGMENIRAFMVVTALQGLCNILDFYPPDIEENLETASYIMVNGFAIRVETELDADTLRQTVLGVTHVKSAHIIPLSPSDLAGGSQPDLSGDRYDALVFFDEDCGMENLRSFMLINSLRQSCKIHAFVPETIEHDPSTSAEISKSGFSISLETPLSEKALQELLSNSMYVRSAKIVKVKAKIEAEENPSGKQDQVPEQKTELPAEETATKAAAPTAARVPVKQNLISVSLAKLDQLMDLMGELVITESMVTRSPDLKGVPNLDNFHKSARQLRKLTDELQDMVMSIRMVPVASTFQKMQRIVRDMSHNLGKDADLVTMGEETDIDKTIIDSIADPIMHLVRNAMDHGVETPAVRTAAGKPAKATVTLSAQNTGGEILITVSDDGKGLDAEALLKKAKAQDLLTKPAAEYTHREAFQLLTLPGFSTKEQVTEYSGRGVGMDVVKKNIEKIGGSVQIESKKGYGTSVFLKIPLTLAIVDGMDISVGGGIYTLQINTINESFKATRDQVIRDTGGNEMIMIRGNVYPILRLHKAFDIPDAITDIEEGILVWVQSGEKSACLFADKLIGEQQIVVKPLPPYFGRYGIKRRGISGCTILGDGNISLILDVGGLINNFVEKR